MLTELKIFPNGKFRQAKGLQIDGNDVEGGRYVRQSDEELCVCEQERGGVWEDYVGLMRRMIEFIMWKEMW